MRFKPQTEGMEIEPQRREGRRGNFVKCRHREVPVAECPHDSCPG